MSGSPDSGKIVLYDGVCNLCDGTIRFILPRDRAGRFRFAALQGTYARDLLGRNGMKVTDPPESVLLYENGRILDSSTAMLRIFRDLGAPWSALGLLLAIPRPVRDAAYRWIARNRYRWFGRAKACLLPRPEWKSRFLD